MPAFSSQILGAVETVLGTLFPGDPVTVRRASEKHPVYMPGDPGPGPEKPLAIVVTGNDGQPIQGGTAFDVICRYPVTVHVLTREIPGTKGEDHDARDAQEAIRKRFDSNGLTGVPVVSQCDPQVLRPYEPVPNDPTVSDSAVLLAFETYEPRN